MDKNQLRTMFSAQPEKFYNIQILKKFGFTRKKCKKCGAWFWSINKDTCGDTACEGGYSFIGKQDKGWDFLSGLEKWERFFEQNKHKVVEPYPVVARWRKDLYFVIASIADFQPWVLKGEALPPGNPLVISQPCLRFNDLDNVGRTGRHFSMFFMGGQHAFNLHDYWVDQTIYFSYKFLTEVLGIAPEDITYREDVWMGGGNFGPSVEAFAHGLELVNHVFMQFEETPTGYREMDRRVVDTGWGLERLVWYATGKVNAYEAVFPMAAKLRQDLGIELDTKDPIWEQMGLFDIEDGTKLPPVMKGKLESMKRLHDLYTLLDHTRAIAFALAGGALPSNVGGGYNIRTLLRRCFSIIETNKFPLSVAELIKDHARYYSKRFKLMKEMPDVEEIVQLELERYKQSNKKGREFVEKYLKKGNLQEKLKELYESHGVSPELVVQIAKKKGVEIEVPEDFYSSISKDERKIDHKVIRELPETRPLFYDRPPEEPFEATVLWSDGNELVLDKTQFYPTGGGQIHDVGLLESKEKTYHVVDVKKEGKAIVHILDVPAPRAGTKLTGKIYAERRRAIMRHHTAVHIVNGSARKVLGNHVWQAGAEKNEHKARLDITHYKPITREEIREIEKISNEIVIQNLKVRKMEMPRTEAEQKYGFRLYQGGAVPGSKLRTVNILGHDVEACGGTHCEYTGELGLIKITSAKRIQDGVVRLELVAGMPAVQELWHLEDIVREASEAAGSEPEGLANSIKKMKKRIKALSKTTGDVTLNGKDVKWAVVDMPFKQMENLAKKKLQKGAIVLVSKEGGVCVVSKGKPSAVELAKKVSQALGADAGGTDLVARGGAKNVNNAEKVLKKFFG